MPHNSHPRGLDPSSDGQNVQKDTLDLFISAGFGQGFAAAPKALGDLFESITGAIFIDSGGDLDVLWRVRSDSDLMSTHPALCLAAMYRLEA